MQQAIQITRIQPGKNPRTYFDPAEMDELKSSIKAKGVIQPILVRPLEDGRFQVVAGHRRFLAAKEVHGDDYEMPVVVKELDDAEADELALVENVHRANMSPTEEAEAAAKILARCQGDRDEAARRLGWSRTTMDKRLALMNCSESVRKALTERKISLGHAELLAAVTKEKQDAILDKILTAPALPTVAQMRAQLESIAKPLAEAIFDKAECAACQHNSGQQRAMFGESIGVESACTNGACYDQKVEAALAAKAESMKDEFPTVKIVRAGENFTLLKLVADGALGVGEEQSKACRGCANFGAAVSAVPGKVGKVFADLCFDPVCNQKMVAARIKADKAAQALAIEPAKAGGDAETGQAAGSKTEKSAKSAKPAAAAKPGEVSQRVKDYRAKVWREALRKELLSDPGRNLIVLIALGMTGNGRHISSTKLSSAFGKLTGKNASVTNPAEAAALVAEADDKVRDMMRLGLTASVSDGIEEHNLKRLLEWMQADLGKHWKLNQEYLDLLTKSEIGAVAEEIGLKAHIGEKEFSKKMSGKKDEIVKALLNVEGFASEGKVPKALSFSAEVTA